MSFLKKTLAAGLAASTLAFAPAAFAGGHHHHHRHHHHVYGYGYSKYVVYKPCYQYGWVVDHYGYKKWVCVASW